MKRILLAFMILTGMASPAFAFHCPQDAAKIRAALEKTPNAEAAKLLEEGMRLHRQGEHSKSLDALHKAMDLLGLLH